MLTDSDSQVYRLGESERDSLLAQHRASPKPELQALSYELPALDALAKTVSELLSTTVISRAIQSLNDDPALSEWLRQGIGLHRIP
jgi:hypothetical protein